MTLNIQEVLKELQKIHEADSWEEAHDRALDLEYTVGIEASKEHRKKIYQAACKVLKNQGENQFKVAKRYADAVVNGNDYFFTDDHHEIGGFYTKTGRPYVVYFD